MDREQLNPAQSEVVDDLMQLGAERVRHDPEEAIDGGEVMADKSACLGRPEGSLRLGVNGSASPQELHRVGSHVGFDEDRPGQVAGLHRNDPHLMMDSRALGCSVDGAHVHVTRRQNENGAWSKSKKSWAMPVDHLVVMAFDQYVLERHELLGSGGSDLSLRLDLDTLVSEM